MAEVTKQVLRAYLLGQLQKSVVLEVEEEILVSDDLYEEVEEAEHSLMADYLVNRLSHADRQQFESYFLRSPARKEQLEVSRALYQVAGEHLKPLKPPAPTPQPTPSLGMRLRLWWQSFVAMPQLGAIAAALFLLVTGALVWSFVRNGQLQEQLRQEQVARAALEQQATAQSAQVESLNRQVEEEKSLRQTLEETVNRLTRTEDSVVPSPFSAVLNAFLAGLPKGEGGVNAQKLIIPANADVARLQFPVQTDRFTRYNVSLLRLDGTTRKELRKFSGLSAGKGRTLRVQIAAALLKPGRYALQMTGIGDDNETESVGEYSFEVVRSR